MNDKCKRVPMAADVERAVIGEMILEPDETVRLVIEAGGAELFYDGYYLLMYSALEHMYEHGEPIDQLTFTEQLKKNGSLDTVGGELSVGEVCADTGSAANIRGHVDILRGKALLRKIAGAVTNARNACSEPAADGAVILKNLKENIQSLREFQSGKNLTLADEIREWILSSNGVFYSSDIYKELGFSSFVVKKNCSRVLSRLVDEGLIERYGKRYGAFRRIEGDCEKMDWKRAQTEVLDIAWPFQIERYVEVMPGNVAVIAGEPNAGKTAFLLNFVRMNMRRRDIHYFSSEMGAPELHKRLSHFEGIAPADWKFNAWERSGNFADVIRPGAVNIVDYLEIHDEFYRLGGQIKAIYDRLRGGIAVIAIQKNRNTDLGRGGIATLEKPRLYIAMSPGELTIVKGKNWASRQNPNGLKLRFKLMNGAEFTGEGWVRE